MQTISFAICNWNTNLLQSCRTPFQNQQFILKEKNSQYPQLIGVCKITECSEQVYENALSFPFLCSALSVLHMPCFGFLFYSLCIHILLSHSKPSLKTLFLLACSGNSSLQILLCTECAQRICIERWAGRMPLLKETLCQEYLILCSSNKQSIMPEFHLDKGLKVSVTVIY